MTMRKVDDALQKIEKAQLICAWSGILFVTFMLDLDVILRFFFDRPLPASWEISEVVMAYIVMFGFAYTLTKDVHVRVRIITDRLPPKAQLGCDIFRNMISMVMCAIITYWSWLRFWVSFMVGEEILAAIKIPWWVGKFAMPLAFAMFGVRYLILLILNFTESQQQ